MSMLMNALRTAVGTLRAPATPAFPQPAPVVPAPPDGAPVWRHLTAQVGVSEGSYGDIARPGMKDFFAHAPRRLLDIGCAGGAVAAALKREDPELWAWGCELNPHSAAVAATRLDHVTSVARPEWSAEDVARLKTVDTVLLFDVLEHMFNPWAELEFLAAHLSQGAQVIVSLPNAGHLSVLDALASGSFPYAASGIQDVTHVRFFALDDMLAMFDQTGFAVEETRIVSRTSYVEIHTFPSQMSTANVTLTVQDEKHWDRLNAYQYGFRLRPKPGTAARP